MNLKGESDALPNFVVSKAHEVVRSSLMKRCIGDIKNIAIYNEVVNS